MNPGAIVRCRHRDWVLLPADTDDVWVLRPLTGTGDDVVKVHQSLTNLVGYDLPAERVTAASFPLPTVADLSDAASAHLLWQAARLTLREGATPFRSLGRISIRPRVYQFVPLLMALRLDPVRLFIADDVGVGKTIEALLVAKELLDRGEIRRFCVLCPPYLCEQWAKELAEKFNLEPVVIRSGTVGGDGRHQHHRARRYPRKRPSLAVILRQGGVITFARRFIKWPGAANVEVNLVGIRKRAVSSEPRAETLILDGQPVPFISSRLDPEPEGEPKRLPPNEGKAFQGDIVRGIGFVLDPDEAEALLAKDPRNADCCVFRRIPTLISTQSRHRFRRNPDSQSDAKQTAVGAKRRWLIDHFRTGCFRSIGSRFLVQLEFILRVFLSSEREERQLLVIGDFSRSEEHVNDARQRAAQRSKIIDMLRSGGLPGCDFGKRHGLRKIFCVRMAYGRRLRLGSIPATPDFRAIVHLFSPPSADVRPFLDFRIDGPANSIR